MVRLIVLRGCVRRRTWTAPARLSASTPSIFSGYTYVTRAIVGRIAGRVRSSGKKRPGQTCRYIFFGEANLGNRRGKCRGNCPCRAKEIEKTNRLCLTHARRTRSVPWFVNKKCEKTNTSQGFSLCFAGSCNHFREILRNVISVIYRARNWSLSVLACIETLTSLFPVNVEY